MMSMSIMIDGHAVSAGGSDDDDDEDDGGGGVIIAGGKGNADRWPRGRSRDNGYLENNKIAIEKKTSRVVYNQVESTIRYRNDT